MIAERGAMISRDDLDEIRAMFARHPDPVEAVEARQAAFEAIWLVVNDPTYKGDITPADLGEGGHEEIADRMVADLLRH
jgi:hypothetical protein